MCNKPRWKKSVYVASAADSYSKSNSNEKQQQQQ
jgi:hypothetical protein